MNKAKNTDQNVLKKSRILSVAVYGTTIPFLKPTATVVPSCGASAAIQGVARFHSFQENLLHSAVPVGGGVPSLKENDAANEHPTASAWSFGGMNLL
jgi:hypothetical protein